MSILIDNATEIQWSWVTSQGHSLPSGSRNPESAISSPKALISSPPPSNLQTWAPCLKKGNCQLFLLTSSPAGGVLQNTEFAYKTVSEPSRCLNNPGEERTLQRSEPPCGGVFPPLHLAKIRTPVCFTSETFKTSLLQASYSQELSGRVNKMFSVALEIPDKSPENFSSNQQTLN